MMLLEDQTLKRYLNRFYYVTYDASIVTMMAGAMK